VWFDFSAHQEGRLSNIFLLLVWLLPAELGGVSGVAAVS
jgi:hypothetical protein